MTIVSALPFNLQNGTIADATQVMADFNQIKNDTNANAAHNGVNNDITALTAVTSISGTVSIVGDWDVTGNINASGNIVATYINSTGTIDCATLNASAAANAVTVSASNVFASTSVNAPNVVATSASFIQGTNPTLFLQDATGATTFGELRYDGSNVVLYYHTGAQYILMNGTDFISSNPISSNAGYRERQGVPGPGGTSIWNLFYNNAAAKMQLWVDNTNLGDITVTSDYRIKKNVADLSSTWRQVQALRPVSYSHQTFDIVKGDDVEHWGFIAHELQETLIEDAATGKKDVAGMLQSPNPWTVIAALTKALQEAMTRIEALESRP